MSEGKILIKKQEALKYFLAMLRQSKAKGLVKKAILFGSLKRKEAGKESDIDLMLFCTNPKAAEAMVDDLAFKVLLDDGELIEPQFRSLKDYTDPRSYFVWQAIHQGKELTI